MTPVEELRQAAAKVLDTALMSPAVAEPLAAWLESVAAGLEISEAKREAGWAPFISSRHPALAVARALNGGAS